MRERLQPNRAVDGAGMGKKNRSRKRNAGSKQNGTPKKNGGWKAVKVSKDVYDEFGIDPDVEGEDLVGMFSLEEMDADDYFASVAATKDSSSQGDDAEVTHSAATPSDGGVEKDAESTVEAPSKKKQKQKKKRKREDVDSASSSATAVSDETPGTDAPVAKPEEGSADQSTDHQGEEDKPKQPAKKKRKKAKKKKDASKQQQSQQQQVEAAASAVGVKSSGEAKDGPPPSFNDLKAWKDLSLDSRIMSALRARGFTTPTPIQTLCLPAALTDRRDIIGAAETGSGKTLAFGLPIVQRILEEEADKSLSHDLNKLKALILTPTRELAMQIADHIRAMCKFNKIQIVPLVGGISEQKQRRLLRRRPGIVVATPGRFWELYSEGVSHLCDLSGLRFFVMDEADRLIAEGHYQELNSIIEAFRERYERVPSVAAISTEQESAKGVRKPTADDVDVSMQSESDELATAAAIAAFEGESDEEGEGGMSGDDGGMSDEEGGMSGDEGGMSDIEGGEEDVSALQDDFSDVDETDGNANSDIESDVESDPDVESQENEAEGVAKSDNFSFRDHFPVEKSSSSNDLSEQARSHSSTKKSKRKSKSTSSAVAVAKRVRCQIFLFSATIMLDNAGRERLKRKLKKGASRDHNLVQLLNRLPLSRGKHAPFLANLTTRHQTAAKLEETQIKCLVDEKDFYTYYFCHKRRGHTLVFVNAITCLRRLVSVLDALQLPVFALHASMQQRQRLKNLERFQRDEHSILVCTDVAARGLDIPQVDHVVHYQLPRSSEMYIHRSGRTARAQRGGLSLALVAPEEQTLYMKICAALHRPEGLTPYECKPSEMREVRVRVKLARKLDEALHKQSKLRREDNWFRKQAKELDMAFDNEWHGAIKEKGAMNTVKSSSEKKKESQEIKSLRKQLNLLLRESVAHVSHKNAATGTGGARKNARNNNMKHMRTGGQFSKGSRGRGGAFVSVDPMSPEFQALLAASK